MACISSVEALRPLWERKNEEVERLRGRNIAYSREREVEREIVKWGRVDQKRNGSETALKRTSRLGKR